MTRFLRIGILSILTIVYSAHADVSLLNLFGDHMVLQRELSVPLRGHAASGEKISVSLAKEGEKSFWNGSVEANAEGSWSIKLPLQKAGGPYEIHVQGSNEIVLRDVLFGDVWFCSGQSNMEMNVSGSRDAEKEIAAANYPQLRLIQSPTKPAIAAQSDLVAARWRLALPETVGDFSAVAYFFGRDLNQHLNIPIGVIQSAVGGTPAERWINEAGAQGEPELADLNAVYVQESQKFGPPIVDKGWEAADFPDGNWKTMAVPGAWEQSGQGLDHLDGAVWFRREVTIPDSWAGKALTLHFAPIDDGDVTYFNGTHVGAMNLETPNVWLTPRQYSIPAELVKSGKSTLAVRVTDQAGGGGFIGNAGDMWIAPTENLAEKISLVGPWKYSVVDRWPTNEVPFSLYNGMVSPWTQFPIKGFVWYQGEGNAGNAPRYLKLLHGLITSWREAWKQPDLPFYIVQLPNYQPTQAEPTDGAWAQLRESQAITASEMANVGLAVTIDLGEVENIHPLNKQGVADRVARLALAQVYHQKLPAYGPVCDDVKTEGGTIRLHFSNVGTGLQAKGDSAKGFAVAGEDNQFVWADATIVGDSVTLKSDRVAAPVHVRYAWADTPSLTIYNSDGLPMAPFRIESGKLIPAPSSK